MALDQNDILEMWDKVYNKGPEVVPNSFIFVQALDTLLDKNGDPDKSILFLISKINKLEEEEKKIHPWKNDQNQTAIVLLREFLGVVYGAVEEVPLHINGEFAPIAKWRLKNGK